jgi:ABC-type uncharacterized transport system ATPase subunit
MEYLLEALHVTKIFGTLKANDDVTLRVKPGEIHAFLGENGAGKSTLVKMIYGALQPTSGEFRWMGRTVSIASPAAARKLGIGMVFQHFSLFEALTVAENIALAMPGQFDMAGLSEKIARISKDYGLPVDPAAVVADLSVGERQRIEIVRCLLQEPKLLIMDEPTAVLTPQEADQLFVTLARLAAEGCAVIYISHRLEEVKRLCHSATILRHGKVVANVDPTQETAASLARLMVGGDIHVVRAASKDGSGTVRLRLDHLNLHADGPFAVELKDISLDVHAGEVVAIAGVAGNGQSELFDAVSGEREAPKDAMIQIDGRPMGHHGVNVRRRTGAAFVPDPEARSLSGGNLQKFVVGRELDRRPGVLVVNQPTWGVDAGASATIRQAIIDLARQGSAVLVISQDLDEIFEIADRIAVISRGQLSEAYPASGLTAERIGLLMAGAHELKETAHAARA